MDGLACETSFPTGCGRPGDKLTSVYRVQYYALCIIICKLWKLILGHYICCILVSHQRERESSAFPGPNPNPIWPTRYFGRLAHCTPEYCTLVSLGTRLQAAVTEVTGPFPLLQSRVWPGKTIPLREYLSSSVSKYPAAFNISKYPEFNSIQSSTVSKYPEFVGQ